MPTYVQLCIVHGQPAGKRILLSNGIHVVGHGPECRIRPNSEWVSRQHCLLHVTAEGVRLRDLGSNSGTLLNGIRVSEECLLKDGDLLAIGPLVLRVCLENAV